MAIEVVMPRLGWTMETGVLVEWMKHDGDAVKPGDILFTVESDKAVNEVEAFDAGILRIPPDSPPPGSTLPVGGLLAYIVQPGEAAPFEGQPSTKPTVAQSVQAMPANGGPSTISVGVGRDRPLQSAQSAGRSRNGMPTISPRARRIADELGVEWKAITGSGRTGRIVERDIRAAAEQQKTAVTEVKATPIARLVAEELGVDLHKLSESKPGKRLDRADVEAAVQKAALPMAPAMPATAADQVIPISPVRRITAERMAASAHTTAPVTLTSEVDATELVKLRNQIKADAQQAARPVPSYTDLLIKLCVEALSEHPMVNARLDGDSMVIVAAMHIGIAVDTDRGLLVPVLRDVQGKSLRRITQDSAVLIERARTGKLSSDEMSGGTFTITNLGMFEIDTFTPIINLPECAILGVGRIVPKQVVIDAEAERVAIRQMMFLSLTFDHRLVDGAQAARFLQQVKQFVEKPYLWLV